MLCRYYPALLAAVMFPERITPWGGVVSIFTGGAVTIAWETAKTADVVAKTYPPVLGQAPAGGWR